MQTRIRRKDGTENLGFRICIGFGIAVPPLPRIVVFRVCLCTSFCVVGFCVLGSSQFLFRLPRRGLPRPTALFSGYHAEGYHARTDAFKLTGYHVCRVTTPELPRSKQTSGYRQVITPVGSFYLFFLSSVIRQCSTTTTTTTSPPSLAHTARTHSTR